MTDYVTLLAENDRNLEEIEALKNHIVNLRCFHHRARYALRTIKGVGVIEEQYLPMVNKLIDEKLGKQYGNSKVLNDKVIFDAEQQLPENHKILVDVWLANKSRLTDCTYWNSHNEYSGWYDSSGDKIEHSDVKYWEYVISPDL
jgi:hypothetical protein